MKLLIFSVIILLNVEVVNGQNNSIYSFRVDSITGQSSINFSAFKGKKIMIVNSASQDTSFTQYEELKQLYDIYKDSLVIVVFPTNSFNTETGSSNQIASAYTQISSNKFSVAREVKVNNQNIHPLYLWLTRSSQNGRLDTNIRKPWYKYLINKSGEFVGAYNPMIRPMSSIMRRAIEINN